MECYEWVGADCELALAGNHEMFVLAKVWERYPDREWAQAAAYAAEQLGTERTLQLGRHPPHAKAGVIEAVHASLTQPVMDFLNSVDQAIENLTRMGRPVLLFGHTHRRALWRPHSENGAARERIQVERRYELPLSRHFEDRCLLNPGAVCDRTGALWLELDLSDNLISATWHRTDTRGGGGRFRPAANER